MHSSPPMIYREGDIFVDLTGGISVEQIFLELSVWT